MFRTVIPPATVYVNKPYIIEVCKSVGFDNTTIAHATHDTFTRLHIHLNKPYDEERDGEQINSLCDSMGTYAEVDDVDLEIDELGNVMIVADLIGIINETDHSDFYTP